MGVVESLQASLATRPHRLHRLIWTGTRTPTCCVPVVSLSGPPYVRPLSQGSNPWADIGCMAAIRIIADNLERAVTDPTDTEARHQMMFAALLAGISFGNAGVHLPHAMSCTDSSLQA